MKQETKKLIERGVIWFAPIFTLIMFALPWMCYFKENITGKITTDTYSTFFSFFDLLTVKINVFTSIIMWVSLAGVVSSIVLYILSVVLKEKEKLLTQIGAIVLVASTGILVLTVFTKISGVETLYGTYHEWLDFMTLPYGLLMVYNIGGLIYFNKKIK